MTPTPAASPFRDGRPVYFAHIQKTGGTSMRRILADGLPQDRVYPSGADLAMRSWLRRARPTETDAFLTLDAQWRSAMWLIADHLAPCLMEHVPGRPILVLMLRDPVDRALSHLGHLQQFSRRHAEFSLGQLFEDPELRARAVADYQVRFLSARDSRQAQRPLDPRSVGADDLAQAIAWLDRAEAIGLTEAFERSAEVVGRAIGRTTGATARLNMATDGAREQALDPVLRARVADAVGLDRDLHAAAAARFAAFAAD